MATTTPSDPLDQRPAAPLIRRQQLLNDPIRGDAYIRLRGRHRRVVQPTWRKIADPAHCSTCGTVWPREPGLALAIIESLLGT